MINVNQITAQLARMPDQALQQYASMHKNDPYTVSLALAESNRRKEMRTAAQGQQGMGDQPKVVDQGIADMAAPAPQPMPEDVGIGALPAPNMQGMAEGGIVAFDNGGSVGMTPEQINERYRQAQLQKLKDFFGFTGVSRGSQSGMTAEEKLAEAPTAAPTPAPVAAAPAVITPGVTPTGGIGNLTQPATAMPLVAAPAAAPAPAPAPGAGGPRAPVAAAAPAGLSYLDQLKKAQTAMGPTVNPEQAAIDKLVGERSTGAAEAKKELEADIASRADQFKGREERIGKREAELGKQKDSNTGMAFLEAGLAMMQARGPGLAAIAQGAGVGLKQYQSGIKDLKLAQEKLDEARDRTDELKQNQSTMDKSAIRAANKDIRDASLSGQQYQIDARMKIYGENKADARAGVASDIATAEAAKTRATQLQAAGIAAAPGLARNKMLADAQSSEAKLRTEYGNLQAKVMAELSKDPMYAVASEQKKVQMSTDRLRQALMNNPFLSSYAAGIGFSKAPAGTQVRELDEAT